MIIGAQKRGTASRPRDLDAHPEGQGAAEGCAACGVAALDPYLRVRVDDRPSDLVPTTDRFGEALADLVRCRECGHGQLERLPSEAELGEAYGEAASTDYVEEEVGQRATARELLALVEHRVERGRLLDLGCWVGFLLAEARARGWEAVGVEPSHFASTYAREHLGLDVRTDDLFEAELPEGAYDVVVLGDVIEHLPRPGDALGRVSRLLAPGGVVLLVLPDAGSRLARAMGARWWSVIPTHVHYFTRQSMAVLLRRRRLEPLYIGTAPKAFSVAYYLGRLGGYSPALGRAAVRAARALGAAERIWAPDFRDRMAVVARAPRGDATAATQGAS